MNLFEGHKTRVDPVFGLMTYMGRRAGYWECQVFFPPAATKIEAFVHASLEDDLEQQHRVFDQMSQQWPAISEAVGPALLERLTQKKKEAAAVVSVWDVFTLSSLSIPNGALEDSSWGLSFECSADPDFLYSVEMIGTDPQSVRRED